MAAPLKHVIAQRIQHLCNERSLTAFGLSMLCDMDASTIYSILGKKSNSPEVMTIKKICDGLDITLSEFFSTPEFDALELADGD